MAMDDSEIPGGETDGAAPAPSKRAEERWVRAARRLLAPLLAWLLRGLAVSWRLSSRGTNPLVDRGSEPRLGALWHRNILVGAGVYRDSGVHIAVSRSRDGDHITAVMACLGFGRAPRGSSSRGGVTALKGMLQEIEQGGAVVIFSDGPRGPAQIAKPGAIAVARLSGTPLIPVGIAARPCLRFGSWDRTILPLPFARVACHYGEALEVARDADPEQLEAARRELQLRLNRVNEEAEAELAQRAS
jgi:lysophospholipid acyltransferase (LPLAT)-like uncharacterized protein